MLNIFNKTKKKRKQQPKKQKMVNSYNGLQTKFSDCAFKTKEKKKKISSALQKT